MTTFRAKATGATAVVVSLATLSACGGGGSASTGGSPAPAVTYGALSAGGTDAAAIGPAAPIPGAKNGGTVTVLGSGGNSSFDPSDAYNLINTSVLSHLLVRSLTQLRFDPKTGTSTLVPDLATGLGRHNKDYTRWTFTLRKGIKFANGRPVTPQDVKYGIERSFDRNTFPDGADYSNINFLHGKAYTGPYGKDKGKNYDGVVVHGQDITIKMSKPFPGMAYWASFPAISPIPPGKASTPAKYALHPWATGPYKIESYTPDISMVLVKNPYWSAKTDPVRRQSVNKYIFKFNTDPSKIDQTIMADHGSAETTVSLTSVLSSDYSAFRSKAPRRLGLASNDCTFFWEPDNRRIKNVVVRRALGWAFPYRSYAVSGGSIPGVTMTFAQNPTPPGVVGRVPYDALPGQKPGETDTKKAKKLLTSVGKLGFTIRWPYETDLASSVAEKNVVVPALKAAGFNPQPVATTSTTASKLYDNPQAKINVRPVEWCPDWPTGGSFLPAMFKSTDLAKVGFGSNYSGLDQPSVDKRMNQIDLLPLKEQGAAWNKLEKAIMSKWYPVIPLSYDAVALMRGSDIRDFHPNGSMPDWNYLWVK